MNLTKPGVWYFTDGMSAAEAADTARRIESLGYSALWIPETVSRHPFAHAGIDHCGVHCFSGGGNGAPGRGTVAGQGYQPAGARSLQRCAPMAVGLL